MYGQAKRQFQLLRAPVAAQLLRHFPSVDTVAPAMRAAHGASYAVIREGAMGTKGAGSGIGGDLLLSGAELKYQFVNHRTVAIRSALPEVFVYGSKATN